MAGSDVSDHRGGSTAGLARFAPLLPVYGSRWALRLGPPLLYLVLSALLYSRFLLHPDRGVPGGADGLLYCWYFSWTEYSIAHLHNPFITDWLNAPGGINSMWNTGVFLLTVLFAPVTAVFGPVVAGGLALTLSPVASASTCYFVLRRITGAGWRAALIGLIYGFGPFFTAQSGHLHLIFAVFPPLVLLLGYEMFVVQRWPTRRLGGWLGLVVGLQLLIGEEILVLTAVVAVLAVLALMVVFPGEIAGRARYAAVSTGIGAVIALVIAGVPLGFQFFGPNALHGGVLASSMRLGIGGLVVPGRFQHFSSAADIDYTQTKLPASAIENTGYLGWLLIAVILAGCAWLIRRRDRFVWWWLLTTGATMLLSFGEPVEIDSDHHISTTGLWSVLRSLPLFEGIVPVRFSLLSTLLVVLLLGWVLTRLPAGRPTIVASVLVAGAMVPLVPAGRHGKIEVIDTPRFFSTAAVDRLPAASTALVLPVSTDSDDGARVMLWQMRAGLRFKLAGGWGVFSDHGRMTYAPRLPDYLTLLNEVGRSGLAPTPAELARYRPSVAGSGIDFIVITDQQQNSAAVSATAAAVTGCRLEPIADVTVCELPPS